jgi:hypothetical protein
LFKKVTTEVNILSTLPVNRGKQKSKPAEVVGQTGIKKGR